MRREPVELFALKNGERVTVRKHYRGCYRVTLTPDEFGQVKREANRMWLAELRDTRTGDLIRFAGLWPTRRRAIEELASL